MTPERVFVIILFSFLTACTPGKQSMTSGTHQIAQQHKQDDRPIGEVTMEADRTLVLNLRAEADDGTVGHGYFRYPPGHPEYAEVLQHVGPIKPGESKLVRPWPETPASATKQ